MSHFTLRKRGKASDPVIIGSKVQNRLKFYAELMDWLTNEIPDSVRADELFTGIAILIRKYDLR